MPDTPSRSRTIVFNDAGDSSTPYVKPAGGIPAADVAADVATQTELDTAQAAATSSSNSTQAAIRSASTKGFVNHGTVASTARPSGYASVEWVGTVEPTNAINGDTWVGSA